MRVLCHSVHGKLSVDMIWPVAKELRDQGHEVFWSMQETRQADDNLTLQVLKDRGQKLVHCWTASDVVLHADPRCCPKNGAPVFEIPHGINSKKGYYRPDVKYECDYHLASSEWIANLMKDWHPQTKFLPVGIPKLDGYDYDEPQGNAILICATHTLGLSLWQDCKEAILKLARHEKVILRFHPHVYEVKTDWLEGIPSDIEIDRSDSIATAFKKARAVISDVSSAGMEALGLGFPVVRYETKQAKEHLKENVLEARFNDYVIRVDNPSDLEHGVALSAPAPKEVQRRLIINKGTATKKAVEAILQYA